MFFNPHFRNVCPANAVVIPNSTLSFAGRITLSLSVANIATWNLSILYPIPLPCKIFICLRWSVRIRAKGIFHNIFLSAKKREESFSKLYHSRLKLIETFKPDKGNLLDLGCGAGFFVKNALDRGWKGHGLEMLPEYVKYAQENLGLHQVHQGSLDNSLPFQPETFDVVTMWDLIEHLRHPLACLEKINRATKPGGLLVIWTPNVKNSIFVKEQWLSYGIKQHIYFFSRNSLEQLLQKTGFKIDYIKTNKAKKGLFNRSGTQPFREGNKPEDKLGKLWFSVKRDLKNTVSPLTYFGPLFDLAGYGFNLFIIASKTSEVA